MALLEVDSIDTYYGPSQVLHRTSLSVAAGEVCGVVGRNGMGKTTLVHTIMGFLRPEGGKIVFSGSPIAGLNPERIAGAGIVLVPQARRVFGSLTVGENLRVSLVDRGGTDAWTIDSVCDRFRILGERWNQAAGTLSGGQQQLLAVGRALLGNGQLVLMDEPTEGLDQLHLAAVVDIVRALARSGTAVLLIEQKLSIALQLTDSIHVLVRGTVVESNSTAAVRGDPSAVMENLGFSSAGGSAS